MREGKIESYRIDPADFGIGRSPLESLRGGSPAENAAIITSILAGEAGPRRDAVLLNAALALVAAGSAEDFARGLVMAGDSIDSGRAMNKLKYLAAFTGAGPVKKAAIS